ncbi:MAG: ATP-binding protein [Acidobacteriota bacterium]
MRPSGFSRSLVTQLVAILALCAAVIGLLSWSVRGRLLAAQEDDLLERARWIRSELTARGAGAWPPDQEQLRAWGKGTMRVSAFTFDGELLSDSAGASSSVKTGRLAPALVTAAQDGEASQSGYSARDGRDMSVAVVVVSTDGSSRGLLTLGLPAAALNGLLAELLRPIALAVLLIALLAATLAWYSWWKVSRALGSLRQAAGSFAAGDTTQLVLPSFEDEGLRSLSQALNDMARQLDERLRTITLQEREQHAVLSSLTEAVVATSPDGHVLSLNQAAERLFGTDTAAAEGRPLSDLAREAELESLVSEVLDRGLPSEKEIDLRIGEDTRRLLVHGSLLQDTTGQRWGVVLALADVTRLRQLETVRTDFVANVSHELRTPITSIKGFIETLRDGALEDGDRARHFLGILERQSDRLGAIIEDLLSLSRLESDEMQATPRKRVRLLGVLERASETCSGPANKGQVEVVVDCSGTAQLGCHPELLEQAVVNLVHNAIKASEAGSRVEVAGAEEEDGAAWIEVRDHGNGIEAHHLPRLFERFYRVDKARSRREGGTGLGLAIVKHVAQLHGGRACVESRPGVGTTFRLDLPSEVKRPVEQEALG